jgi:hypothetical protein
MPFCVKDPLGREMSAMAGWQEMAGGSRMNQVFTIPDVAFLRLACKSEEGEQSTTMYDVDQALVDELAYLMEAPKDERPGIFCLGREWIIDGRVMGSLCYDKRKKQHCWGGDWFVILESGDDSMNLLGPLACFSIPIRDAVLRYQESEEKRELFTPWMIEGAARANGYLIEEFRHLPKYQQRGMLLEQKWRERR